MKIMSDKWFQRYESLAQKTFSAGRTPTAVGGKEVEKFLHVPGQRGRDVWIAYEWADGILIEQTHGIGLETAPRDGDFSILLDLSLPKQLLSGKLKVKQVTDSGAFEANINFINFMPVEGPFIAMQILKFVSLINLPGLKQATAAGFYAFMKHKRSKLLKRGVTLK